MTTASSGRIVQGLIELQADRLEHLFDPFDPFPIPTRDLSKGAEEFIVGWAREFSRETPISLRIYLHDGETIGDKVSVLKASIERHFVYRAELARGDLRELFASGRLSLVIGLCVLGVCIFVRQFATTLMQDAPVSRVFAESLLIVGWVANWRPLEIFLYAWWPIVRRRRLYERLAVAPVEVVVRPLAREAIADRGDGGAVLPRGDGSDRQS
jgi:hypothetical protein